MDNIITLDILLNYFDEFLNGGKNNNGDETLGLLKLQKLEKLTDEKPYDMIETTIPNGEIELIEESLEWFNDYLFLHKGDKCTMDAMEKLMEWYSDLKKLSEKAARDEKMTYDEWIDTFDVTPLKNPKDYLNLFKKKLSKKAEENEKKSYDGQLKKFI